MSRNSFKPCYKWNTFNTKHNGKWVSCSNKVLNLVISGIPSILRTSVDNVQADGSVVLNLVISGIPSIHRRIQKETIRIFFVLNLVISGIPSIQYHFYNNQPQVYHVLNLVISGIPSIQ